MTAHFDIKASVSPNVSIVLEHILYIHFPNFGDYISCKQTAYELCKLKLTLVHKGQRRVVRNPRKRFMTLFFR